LNVNKLRTRSCIIDGEAVACDERGTPSFDRIRYRRHDASVFLYAFDLIELNGDDLRRDPLEVRKATLASVLTKAGPGLRLNDHLDHEDGEIVFRHACKLGLEGIASKRKGSPLRALARSAQDEEPALLECAAEGLSACISHPIEALVLNDWVTSRSGKIFEAGARATTVA
jgi:ATP-dependent DNA ligase